MHTSSNYAAALKALNPAQRKAVETIDGPVLVIAGPGTGKTQLLTTRIAHILQQTDTLPQNILCLTFTDSAAHTMRERLAGLIGQAAYDVTVSTYHAFGSELIRRHPDYFVEFSDMQPADDLLIDQVLRAIVSGLPFANPLKFADTYLGDIKTFISDAKRALLTPKDIIKVSEHNETYAQIANPIIEELLDNLARIDKKAMPLFERLYAQLDKLEAILPPPSGVLPLSTLLLQELRAANESAAATGKTTELTKWKNTWLAKNHAGKFVLAGEKTNQKLRAAADVYGQYLAELKARSLYDFDDMILRAVRALEQNPDFRYTVQEQYHYLLLDEFQDTNGAQLRLVALLTDNPVHEGRPNVLAVGDDDQAIYAFQGANYSHMKQFQHMYRDVVSIPLTENYRSHPHILQLAEGISRQIEHRLLADKPLRSATHTEQCVIERRDTKSDAAQFAWVADRIQNLIRKGLAPNEIAVLAPQHKYLEPLVPFLHQLGIPVRYDKRENILDDPIINQLLRMSELVIALASGKHAHANTLWAEILSFPCWGLATSKIWQLSWQANDHRTDWTSVVLGDEALKPIGLFFVRLSILAGSETGETILDYLIGTTPLNLNEPGLPPYRSPLYEHYFGSVIAGATNEAPANFWDLLNSLIILRTRLRDYRPAEHEQLRLEDFVTFVHAHREAGIKILNTNPHREAENAVHLMTAYKSKGQEFNTVFLLGVTDDVWGSKARKAGTRLALPQNLVFMRYAGATNDERIRLFYVAVTRAKSQLFLVGYRANFAGKTTARLAYLQEVPDETGHTKSPLLPAANQLVQETQQETEQPQTTQLQAYWQQRHETGLSEQQLRGLLAHRIERFRLSPTHVTSFIDLEKQGPRYFFMNTILRFPRAPIPTGEFGNAIHETLEWIHRINKQEGTVPRTDRTIAQFATRLSRRSLSPQDYQLFLDRGTTALRAYLGQRIHTIHPDNQSEISFKNEGVFIGNCNLSGNIDKLIVDKRAKTITIVDYKTGKSFSRWATEPKLHRYKMQLYLYKTLVEQAHTWADYKVTDAYLEFVEPDENGEIHELHIAFNPEEQKKANKLAERIWQHVQQLHIPDVSNYSTDLKGMQAFETFLLRDEGEDQTSLWS